MLQGFVAASALVPIAACKASDPGDPSNLPDARPTDDAVQGTGFEVSGNNLLVDLTHPLNLPLTNVGGTRIIPISGDKLIVVREDDTTFVTLSAVCTHAGCSVRYIAAGDSFSCPCHGSGYAIDGSVTNGPAARPLTQYDNSFDDAGQLLTINIA